MSANRSANVHVVGVGCAPDAEMYVTLTEAHDDGAWLQARVIATGLPPVLLPMVTGLDASPEVSDAKQGRDALPDQRPTLSPLV